MLEKLQRAFWKALTPDLLPEQLPSTATGASEHGLSAQIQKSLGGSSNIKSQQHLALTRIRVELHDPELVDNGALRQGGVAATMQLPGAVLHLLVGLPSQ